MNILRGRVQASAVSIYTAKRFGKLMSLIVLAVGGFGIGGCASDAEPGGDESDIKAEKPLHSFGRDGINGTAKSKYNTCSIKQGGMMNNVLTVKCTQASVGTGVCNGSMTIGLKQGLAQKDKPVQTYTPEVDISSNKGWVEKDGVKCADDEALTLVVKMNGELVSSITLNGTAYSFQAR